MSNAGQFRKGKKPGPGRPKGLPNKATKDVREAIAILAQENVGKVQAWLDSIALDDAGKALDLFLRMLEYHIPKIQRSEVTGANGGPVVIAATPADERL